MAADMDILAAEVDRIVTTPYPTQLKSLHDLVSRISDVDICLWAKCYACRVPPLTQALLDALPQWSYVLGTITRLSCAFQIRDSFIRKEPSLLPNLLSQALDLQIESNKYVEASVVFLSHPLPADVALPETAQNFLLRLFDRAVAHPDAGNVRQIHQLVYGACQPIIGILSPTVLSRLEEYIFSILKSSSGVEDQSLGMYCLSIMRVILENFQTGFAAENMWPTFDHCAYSNPDWTPESIKQFFTGNKTHKTMQLLVLRVIWACRPESADPTGQGLISVVLVNQILAGVSKIAVADWTHKNMMVVRKLQEKSLIPDMRPALRFQVLTFLGSLSDRISLPPQTTAFYEKSLLELESFTLEHIQLDLVLRLSLHRTSTKFGSEWWQDFVCKILDLLSDPLPVVLFRSADCYITLVQRLSALIEGHDQGRQALLAALSCSTNRERVETFFKSSANAPATSHMNSSSCCSVSYMSLRDKLKSSFCSFLLQTALAASQDEVQRIRHLLPDIIRQHALVEPLETTCHFCSRGLTKAPRSTLFVEVEATPESQDKNLHWKDRLAIMMQMQAKQHQHTLIASFAEICQELETRCETVEAPLRQERERFVDLQNRHEALSKAYSDIEGQVMDRDLRISALEAENDRHDTDLAAASQETRDLMQRIDRATRELQDANENASKAIVSARQERHELEVQHATAIACKQEALEQVREHLHQAKNEIETMRSDLDQMEDGTRKSNAEYEKLRLQKEHLEIQLCDKQSQAVRAEEERESLSDKNNALEQAIDKLQQDIKRGQNEHDKLLAELEDVKQATKEENRKLSASFEDAMSRAKQEWFDVKTCLDEQLEDVRHELIQAEDGFQQQQEASKHKIAELRKRIDRLTKECSKKDVQVAEAQEMRNRLMNAMGLATVMAAPTDPGPKSSVLPVRSASTTATPRTSLPSQAPLTPACEAYNSEDAEEEGINGSFASNMSPENGPTLKRARPRQSLTAANTQQGRTSIGPRSARSIMRTRSAIKRQPLQDMSTNRSPVRHNRSPSKVAFQDLQDQGLGVSTADRRELEDWSFTADCVLTGTPGLGLKHREGFLEDDSTADV